MHFGQNLLQITLSSNEKPGMVNNPVKVCNLRLVLTKLIPVVRHLNYSCSSPWLEPQTKLDVEESKSLD